MSPRSFSSLSFAFGVAAIAACAAPVSDPVSGIDAPSTVSPLNGVVCHNCEPVMPVSPTSFNFGQLGDLNDPMGGIRRGIVNVVAPKAGTLTATIGPTFNQWSVTSIELPGGTTLGGGPVTVTAGENVVVNFEFNAEVGGEGLLNTNLSIYNEGARALVPLQITTALLYFPTPQMGVFADNTCATYGSDGAAQLGYDQHRCPDESHQFEFTLNVVNVGAETGAFSINYPGLSASPSLSLSSRSRAGPSTRGNPYRSRAA